MVRKKRGKRWGRREIWSDVQHPATLHAPPGPNQSLVEFFTLCLIQHAAVQMTLQTKQITADIIYDPLFTTINLMPSSHLVTIAPNKKIPSITH